MTSRANYDGLTRLQVAGTWSPQPSTFPIVLDKEIRGGLRYCSGADNDTNQYSWGNASGRDVGVSGKHHWYIYW